MSSLRLAPFLAIVALAACSGGGDPPTTGGGNTLTPAVLEASAGHSPQQSATVGTAVGTAPAVRVLTSTNVPVPNVVVTFAVTGGGGSIASTSATTNAQGIASAGTWTLGPTAGANTVTASLGSLTPVQFTATGVAAGPVAAQVQPVGTVVATDTVGAVVGPVRVRVVDAAGTPVAGATVTFAVTAGGGTVSAATATTNAEGQAQTTWTLGNAAGAQTITASVGGTVTPLPVSVTATIPPFFATAIGVSGAYTCAQRQRSTLHCWGANGAGQLGNGTTDGSNAPVAVQGAPTVERLALGPQHVCAITGGGQLLCWGDANGGRLGNGATSGVVTAPAQIATGQTFKAVATGSAHSCAIRSDDAVLCWGINLLGQAGNTGDAVATPTRVGTDTYRAVAAGTDHSCAITTGGPTHCWGRNNTGQLGTGTTSTDAMRTPATVTGGHAFVQIAAGGDFTCALTSAGQAYCWGGNGFGQLGDGTLVAKSAPVAAAGALRFTSISAGGGYACGVTEAGAAHCWGNNTFGTLGNGQAITGDVNNPVRTPNATAVSTPTGVQWQTIAASLSDAHTCGIARTSSEVWCWGTDMGGLLPPSQAYNTTPVRARGR